MNVLALFQLSPTTEPPWEGLFLKPIIPGQFSIIDRPELGTRTITKIGLHTTYHYHPPTQSFLYEGVVLVVSNLVCIKF